MGKKDSNLAGAEINDKSTTKTFSSVSVSPVMLVFYLSGNYIYLIATVSAERVLLIFVLTQEHFKGPLFLLKHVLPFYHQSVYYDKNPFNVVIIMQTDLLKFKPLLYNVLFYNLTFF